MSLDTYLGKKVLVTGHTGFKGSWLSTWLKELGADVIGYSSEKHDNDVFFREANISKAVTDIRGDIRNLEALKKVFDEHKPEIVFHLAAQPYVRKSYEQPHETMDVNFRGTLNVLELLRTTGTARAAVIVSSDKCYKNKEQMWGYRETDEVGGHDTYSASKAAVELLVDSYRKSFFKTQEIQVASARAGNVIGGGDWSADRIVPDCVRHFKKGEPVPLRNPDATRPWQHVLEPLSGYLLLGEKLLSGNPKYADAWNFGPEQTSVVPVKTLVSKLMDSMGKGAFTIEGSDKSKHEAGILSLDITKSRELLGWKPVLSLDEAVKWTASWYKLANETNQYKEALEQIRNYGGKYARKENN